MPTTAEGRGRARWADRQRLCVRDGLLLSFGAIMKMTLHVLDAALAHRGVSSPAAPSLPFLTGSLGLRQRQSTFSTFICILEHSLVSERPA